ncbi:MAG: hypothetical protein ABFD81_01555 [Syntrophaceae bacterium]
MKHARDKALSALLAAFPSPQGWSVFSQNSNNSQIRETFVTFAERYRLIDTADAKALEMMIREHTSHRRTFDPPKHLSFEGLLERKDELLRITLSLRALTDRINTLLAEKQIALPKVTNSMLTRLKKEPVDTVYKQNVLRSLAFWLGHERADIADDWHYETLLTLCREGRQTQNYKEGARIGFALYSRGDVIDHEILGWLRKTLKLYIDQSIPQFSYGRWGKVRAHDITTFYVDFPKEVAASDLATYQQCLRGAVSLAHQMAIRWALSRYCTKNRFLSIAVVVGEFASLDNHLLPLLNAKLPNDPVIRMSDYARQCVLINDIRVVFCSKPTETTLFNGEALSIWWIEALWSTFYFDFVSDLLTDPILQNNAASIKKLNRLLWPPSEKPHKDIATDETNAVSAFLRFPHNALLGVEIAKTLFYRRRFAEAMAILRVVLSINPTDLTARTLRMIILRSIALESPTYETATVIFQQAGREARFILANCLSESEDFYCEYAGLHMAQAMCALKELRANRKTAQNKQELNTMKQQVYTALAKAEDLFGNGISVSPSGIRSAYFLHSVRLLNAILKEDEDIFVNPQKRLSCRQHTVHEVAINVHSHLGIRRSYVRDMPEDTMNAIAEKLLSDRAKMHDDAMALTSYRPTIYFCHAVALWSFLPERTATATEKARQCILKAIEIAESVKKDDLGIYAFTRTYAEMLTPDEFIRHMRNCLTFIDEDAGVKHRSKDCDTVTAAGCAKDAALSLMTLNF